MDWFNNLIGRPTSTDKAVASSLAKLILYGDTIMSAVSDYIAKQNAHNAQQAAAIDSLVESTTGIAADLKALNATITTLQTTPGAITAEDQALLDTATTQSAALADRATAAADALKALDSLTPPTPPAPAVVAANPGGGLVHDSVSGHGVGTVQPDPAAATDTGVDQGNLGKS